MTIADERILEFLHETLPPHQSNQITTELDNHGIEYSDKYVGRRCIELSKYGLLRNLGNGIYTITETGEQYLDGELHAKELEPKESPE